MPASYSLTKQIDHQKQQKRNAENQHEVVQGHVIRVLTLVLSYDFGKRLGTGRAILDTVI